MLAGPQSPGQGLVKHLQVVARVEIRVGNHSLLESSSNAADQLVHQHL